MKLKLTGRTNGENGANELKELNELDELNELKGSNETKRSRGSRRSKGAMGMRQKLVIVMAALLIISMMASCGGNSASTQTTASKAAAAATTTAAQSSATQADASSTASTASTAASSEPAAAAASTTAGSSSEPEPITLPIVTEPLTLTVFAGLADRSAVSITNYNEMLAFQEMEKRTGIHIDFQHPPVGPDTVREQFQLIMASGDYPDMMYYTWTTLYKGGPQKTIEDGVLVSLNSYAAKYAPNFTKILNENDDVRKDAVTDEGDLYMFPLVRLEASDRMSGGFQIRKDWLDKLGLGMPQNKDEWYTVLKAFKEKDPNGNGEADEIPFISSRIVEVHGPMRFTCLWGISHEFYNDNNVVKYGPAEPEYKEFLQTMRQWYAEGLIDPDFLTADRKNHDAKVTSGIAGAYYGLLNSYMGSYTKIMAEEDPSFDIRQAPMPLTSNGKRYNYHVDAARPVATEGFGVTTKNKHLPETIKWLDYFYGEDGRVLMNLGIEGTTFTINNGEYVYTDLITNNPDGLPLDQAICKYTPAGASCRLFQDHRYWVQMMTYPNQKEAMGIIADSTLERVLPPVTPAPDDATRLAAIYSEIDTYMKESFARFITGQDDVDAGFDKYINTMKSLNLDEALAIQQKALDAYNRR